MTSHALVHVCGPTRCPDCVREVIRARDAARAELLPLVEPTTYTAPKEGTREPAAA
ncbi:hypothetical protein [Promicromonospora sp. NPDC050880]|uniref:hypothetical protein n=1 Tax=Promicromonospora sp. NPDC050880 TaxID=3364406 RepID=UPI00379D4CB6